jgi:hypothetical protein
MYLAYSAFNITNNGNRKEQQLDNDLTLRYHAYLAACQKYQREIVEIRKYFPGWAPNPPIL